ncbi:hypothetical protein [Tateyamaria sp. SN3-11]|uniref:hypothetical protein n=1 Tax=Tateyamaria sp. SN3-11 TaxID=3092147 RepID=UPI0039EBA6C6
MKRIFLTATLVAASIVAACGGQSHSVTRAHTAPLSVGFQAPQYDDTTSARSAIDLLSLS